MNRPTGSETIDDTWRELVTSALLGTDRRDPPSVEGALGDLAADIASDSPSERMLALVAGCTSVRRAGVRPLPVAPPIAAPADDARPICPSVAVERWRHVTTSWPVLEDEWTVTLLERGWRLSPALLPAALRRHRRDPFRHARVVAAGGSLAEWLIELRPELGPTRRAHVDPEVLLTVPDLPVPPDLLGRFRTGSAADASEIESSLRDLAADIASGRLGAAHRAVLVNLIARIDHAVLPDIARLVGEVDPSAPGHPLASVLADLATVRQRMLDELLPPGPVSPDRRRATPQHRRRPR